MKVKSVFIQGMHNVKACNHEFNDVTYITGPNGVGKSTILNAIQLALLGYIPGTAKSNSAVMAHANRPDMKVSVCLCSSEGDEVTVTRTFSKKGSSVTSNVDVFPADADLEDILGDSKLPIFDWSEFTSLTSNKMKDWFIEFIPGMDAKVDWEEELSSVISDNQYNKDIVKKFSDKISSIKCDSAVDQVVQANAFIKSKLSYEKAVLSEKENTLNGLLDYNSSGSLEDVDYLKAKLDDCTSERNKCEDQYKNAKTRWTELSDKRFNQLANIKAYNNLKNDVLSDDEENALLDDVKTFKCQLEKMSNKYNELESLYEEVNEDIDKINEKYINFKQTAEDANKVVQSSGVCPYTSSRCESIISAKASYLKTLNEAKVNMKQVESKKLKAVDRQQEIADGMDKLASNIDKTNFQIKKIKNKLEYNDKVKLKLESFVVPDESDVVTEQQVYEQEKVMESFRSKALDLQSECNRLEKSIESSSLIDKITLDKYKLQEKVEILNKWVKLTSSNGLQTTLSSNGFNDLEEKLSVEVNKVFGDDVYCKFNVSTKSNSFNFGIDRNGAYIPYNLLSTGEKTLYTFCLMSYIAKNSNSKLKLVMMDDFFDHLDSKKFSKLMEVVCGDTEGIQIIMAGVASVDSLESANVNVVKL